ncbi:carbohydrate ABC transporter permease [Nonomuraea sp. NPDC000554]|uniref:carbohydrate ABC transporter permease n=1 Tax=Nonomuraea sp. NPDC000554 TaxID=3154259 RepID=UPI0033328AD2
MASTSRRYLGKRAGYHAILVLIAVGFLFPFAIMLFTAFKDPQDIFQSPQLLPRTWTVDNFGDAVRSMPYLRYVGNTLVLVVLNVLGTLLSCPLVAYALAKLRWRGRDGVFLSVLATMMLPPQITFIPLYLLWNEVGGVGTFLPLVIPQFFGTGFYIFLLRQFFTGIPDSLREAARLDGASELRIYLQIMLPLAKPALATVAVFQFVATWTDFLLPLIYLNDDSKYTLSIGLYSFFGEHGVQWGPLMAACVFFTAPAVIVFMIMQRYFVRGIAITGMK